MAANTFSELVGVHPICLLHCETDTCFFLLPTHVETECGTIEWMLNTSSKTKLAFTSADQLVSLIQCGTSV